MSYSDTIDNTPTISGDGAGQILSGRYQIIRQLGAGGMGVVYLARDMELDIEVAVKVLPSILLRNTRAIENLRREARTALKLSHPNIVRLHTFQSEEEIKYLVMEYVDGGNLEDKIAASGRLEVSEGLSIFTQVAAGLDYAHSQNVLHRDIKPANIMLTQDGRAKLADFGIARQIKDSMTRITGKETSGTLLYMAPEQFRGGEPDVRSDIYSLAASFYECATGHPPFWRGAIEHQILNEIPSPADRLSAAQNDALLAALSKSVDQRPNKAEGFINGIRGYPKSQTTKDDTGHNPQSADDCPGGDWADDAKVIGNSIRKILKKVLREIERKYNQFFSPDENKKRQTDTKTPPSLKCKTSNIALGLAICGLFFGLLTAIPAVFVGKSALKTIESSNGRLTGYKSAKIAIWLSYIIIGINMLVFLMAL